MTETEEQPKARGTIPLWLAIVLIVLFVAGGAWFVWRTTFKKPAEEADAVVPEGDGIIMGRAIDVYQPVRGLQVRSGDAELLQRGSSVWVFYKLQELDRIALQILDKQPLAKHVSLTDAQRRELAKLEYDVPTTPQQRQDFEKLISEYVRFFIREDFAEAAVVAEKLKAAVTEAAAGGKDRAEEIAGPRVRQIRSILSDQQVELARAWLKQGARQLGWLALSPAPTLRSATVADARNPRGDAGRAPTTRQFRVATTRPNGDGVTFGGNMGWHVKSGPTEMLQRSLMSWVFYEPQELDRLVLHMFEVAEMRQQAGVTSEQRRELARLKYDVAISEDERRQLQKLLYDYRQVYRTPDQAQPGLQKLLDALTAVGAAHREEAQLAAGPREKRIREILGSEQILKAKRWWSLNWRNHRLLPISAPPGNFANPRPPTRPTNPTTAPG